ncbi:MAG: GNAT family N-acetyltransferase [Oscillospiraceae bacterium]|nr:GNAT family N-acetyltransferase [Oscillospiraceae bacterium]
MLRLQAANWADAAPEYAFITAVPAEENGFTNPASGCTWAEFQRAVLPGLLDAARGAGLPEGWVPQTDFFLWEGAAIAGWFRVRHFLTPALAAGAGHIGYCVGKAFRRRGLASAGLRLAVERAWELIREDEICLSVRRDNPASLRVQLKNGAYIHHADADHFYTRIKKIR